MATNWKTTLAGVATLAIGAILISLGQIGPGVACIPVGLGLIASKDSNVTGGTKQQ